MTTAYAGEVRPDAGAADELSSAVKDANKSEQEMVVQGEQDPLGPSGATITLGMTPAQVEAALGRPRSTADLGAKTIYLYKDLKVTFLNGRVSDVQ